jgi:tetratricopeptide (TPR) repeat protein
MRKRTVLVVIALLLGCSRSGNAGPPSASSARLTSASVAPPAAASSDTAIRLQRSYDAEAGGDLPGALAALDGVIDSGNAGYVAQLRRAWLLYRLEKHADSVAAYQRAIALDADSIEARVGMLAPLGALRRWVDVERDARDVLAKDPASYTATIRLAYALYSQAKFADAATTYRVLLHAYPSDVEVRAGLGWALLKAGHADQAATTFDEVLTVAPKNALALDGAAAARHPAR